MTPLKPSQRGSSATIHFARVGFLQRCLVLCYGWLALCAHAAFPQAAVTMIVPGPAGSGTDQVARLLSDEFARLLAQPVVIENKAGASGSVGVQLLMRAKPDGYTIMIGHVSTHGIVPALRKPKPYDPVDDFVPIGAIGSSSNVLVIAPDQKITNLAEFIAYGKRQPLISYGSPGVGLSQHFDGYSFGKVFGFDMLHVPYKGTGVDADRKLTSWRCGGKVGLLGGSSCTHTKTEFEQLSFISSSINASRRPLLSWDIPQRMHSRLGVENMSSDKTCQWVMHDLG